MTAAKKKQRAWLATEIQAFIGAASLRDSVVEVLSSPSQAHTQRLLAVSTYSVAAAAVPRL